MRRTIPAIAALGLLLAAAPQNEPTVWERRLEAASKSEDTWKARKAGIRRQILVSAGLWPEFERPALRPVVFGKLEREGYSVEKVHLETLPGFHLTGNLYRPLDQKGPFPGVVSPHGHWKNGRFNDTKEGSVPGRAITLARLGFVVFSYDMVGYGDFKQLPHKFSDPAWGMGLLGLQLWNSLRAVDFVESLPDVDPKRLGATGASGGGTQTFLLTAVDDRIACAAPVNMVAGEFQGGCSCENAPFLRIDLNNVEIAACTAPRPLLLVCCTGDWTKNVPTFEGPVIQRAYKALGVEDRFRVVQFNYGHNYNQDSREAVYAWFARWLQGKPDAPKIPEPAFAVEKKEDLAVFGPDHPLPDGAVDAEGLMSILRKRVNAQIETLFPRDADGLRRFRELMLPALTTTLTARAPKPAELSVEVQAKATLVVTFKDNTLLKTHQGPILVLSPHPDTPEPPSGGNKEQLKGYPATFFRTGLARQIQSILDMLACIASRPGVSEITLVGEGEAGIPALLAAALTASAKLKQVIVDLNGLEDSEALWTGPRDHPAMLRVGGLRTAAVLCAPRALVLHNTRGKLDAGQVRDAYRAAGAENALTVSDTEWDAAKILEALK